MIILLKTVGDRPEMLAQTVAAWENVADAELRVLTSPEPMGVGLDRAYHDVGDDEIAVICSDDTVPTFTNLDAPLEMYHRKEQPSPRYLKVNGEPWAPYDGDPDGSPSDWTRFPMATGRLYRELGPFIATTSYLDFDYSTRLTIVGWKITLCHAFSFTHLDGSHAWETPEVHAGERAIYEAARRTREPDASLSP